jgi:hypothetical protein
VPRKFPINLARNPGFGRKDIDCSIFSKVPECKESILGARTMLGTPQLSQLNCDTISRLHHVSPTNDETRVQPFMRGFEPVDFWLEIIQNSL